MSKNPRAPWAATSCRSRDRPRCPIACCARWTRRSSTTAVYKLAKRCLEGIKTIFKTTSPVIIYTATGTGAWKPPSSIRSRPATAC